MKTKTEPEESRSAYTPSPWLIGDSGDFIYALYVPEKRENRHYENGKPQQVNRFWCSVSGWIETPKSEVEANARLIAASRQCTPTSRRKQTREMPKRNPLSPRSSGLLDTWGRHNRKHADKLCANCGTTFRPRRTESRYCSRKCLWANNGGQNRKAEVWWRNAKGYIEGRVWIDGKQVRYKLHRWLLEQKLGRRLLPNEDAHHINGNKSDNRIENLEVIDHAKHAEHHNAKRRTDHGREAQALL